MDNSTSSALTAQAVRQAPMAVTHALLAIVFHARARGKPISGLGSHSFEERVRRGRAPDGQAPGCPRLPRGPGAASPALSPTSPPERLVQHGYSRPRRL